MAGDSRLWTRETQLAEKISRCKKLGIPSHDTFCRVFGLINHLQLQERVVDALRNNLELIKRSLHIDKSNDEYRHLCIDGKEENGTGRKYQSSRKSEIKNMQTLHVFDSSSQICLFSQEIDEKTNEINIMDLTQKKIVEIEKTLPTGLKIVTVHDDTKFVRESIKEVEFTVLLTSIIVILIIFVFCTRVFC